MQLKHSSANGLTILNGLLIALIATACGNSDFSGKAKKDSKEPAAVPKVVLNDPDNAAATAANATPVAANANPTPTPTAPAAANPSGPANDPSQPQSDQQPDSPAAVSETFTLQHTAATQAEVYFFLDTSSSMTGEISDLILNLATVWQKAETNQAIAMKIVANRDGGSDNSFEGVLSGLDIPEATKESLRAAVIDRQIDSHDSLAIAAELIAEGNDIDFTNNRHKQFVFITDDDARDFEADDFIDLLDETFKKDANATPSVAIDGVFWTGDHDDEGDENCVGKVGDSYADLTSKNHNPKYAGQDFDICTTWNDILDDILASAASKLTVSYAISGSPTSDSLTVTVAGKTLNPDQYTFDSETKTLSLHPAEIAGPLNPGDEVVLTYLPTNPTP